MEAYSAALRKKGVENVIITLEGADLPRPTIPEGDIKVSTFPE